MKIIKDRKNNKTFPTSFEGGKVYFYEIKNSHLAEEGQDWEFVVLKEIALNKVDKKGQPMFKRVVSLIKRNSLCFLIINRQHQLVAKWYDTKEEFKLKFEPKIKNIKILFGKRATLIEYVAIEPIPEFVFNRHSTIEEWLIDNKYNFDEINKAIQINSDVMLKIKDQMTNNCLRLLKIQYISDEVAMPSWKHFHDNEYSTQHLPNHYYLKLEKNIYEIDDLKYYVTNSGQDIISAVISELFEEPFEIDEDEIKNININNFRFEIDGTYDTFYIIPIKERKHK